MLYSNILVPIDGSQNSFRALRHGLFLSSKLQSELSVLYVLETPPFVYIQSQKVINSITSSLEEEAKKVYDKVDQEAKEYGVAYQKVILKGHPVAAVIIKYSEEKEFDTIIIGSRGHGKIKTAILGSVSHHVVNNTKIPLTLVK